MPTLTIDDRVVTVEPGTRVIQAADALGIEIPRFCYHPGLSVAANCRMCLVESNKSPKLVPACHEVCQDGMVIKTRSARVLEARRAVLEFILLNHPVDCPICDQAGECELQELYYKHDRRPSRHMFRKLHKPKAVRIGPRVVYDAERCINCTRCVRFCDEVTGTHELRQVQRGERTYIEVFPGRALDNAYSMCTADLCPVGALTTDDFRFKCRVWFLSGTETVCPECSRGCAVRVDTWRGAIQRVVPRHDPGVNGYWACDAGRLAYHRFETGRLAGAMVKGERTSYTRAVKALADALLELPGDVKVSVALSASLTHEDARRVMRFVLARWSQVNVGLLRRPEGEADRLLVRADRDANRVGVTGEVQAAGLEVRTDLSDAEVVLVVTPVGGVEGEVAERVRAARLSMVVTPFETEVLSAADFALPAASPYESGGTFTNEFGVVRRLVRAIKPLGEARQVGDIFLDLAERMGVEGVA